jgi:hypothetical protein
MPSVWEERRAGRFRVAFETVKELPDSLVGLLETVKELPDSLVGLLFGSFLIVRAEHCIMDGCVHYEAVSRLFEPVDEGGKIPWYKVRLNRVRLDQDGLDDDYELVVERRNFPR